MKTHNKNPFLPPVLVAALGLMVAGQVSAQADELFYRF
jgi:hypothetical protein